MQISVETTGPSIPSVTFPELNQGVDVALVDSKRQQSRDFDTGEPAVWDDGNPRMETVNIGLVIKATAQNSFKDENNMKAYRDLEVGELVKIHLKGQHEKAWFEAVTANQGNVNVGDKVRHVYNAVGQAKKANWNPPKLFSVALSADVDPELRAQAEAKAKELAAVAATPVAVSTPAAQPAGAGAAEAAGWDEESF